MGEEAHSPAAKADWVFAASVTTTTRMKATRRELVIDGTQLDQNCTIRFNVPYADGRFKRSI